MVCSDISIVSPQFSPLFGFPLSLCDGSQMVIRKASSDTTALTQKIGWIADAIACWSSVSVDGGRLALYSYGAEEAPEPKNDEVTE